MTKKVFEEEEELWQKMGGKQNIETKEKEKEKFEKKAEEKNEKEEQKKKGENMI